MRERRGLRPLRVASAIVVLATGCSVQGPVGDKAGGAPGAPIVLHMALISSGPLRGASRLFVRDVESLSGGNVRIEPIFEWGSFTPTAERQVVRAVAVDTVDLGIAETSVFDTMGNDTFRALLSPMLVDSYHLQGAILRSDIAHEMLDGLTKNGVVGLAMLAGSLLKPVGVEAPLLGPDDWRGITFGTYLSMVSSDMIRALGATPRTAFGSLRWRLLTLGQLQGYALGLALYKYNLPQTAMLSPYITANVTLWPWMQVLVANPDRLTTLTPQQLSWLKEAAKGASSRSPALAESERGLTTLLCNEGVRFANASKDDLAWLRQVFGPLYARLEQDPQTKSYISQIRALKGSIAPDPPLVIQRGCLIGRHRRG
jgi:TRAP-type C4-dicarboxylate transport system substrate-binding protein